MSTDDTSRQTRPAAAVAVVVAEEDEVREDDWGLPCDFFLFSQHQTEPLWLGGESSRGDNLLQILCVESLTPLDMMNLSSGVHDATGHCVWTAAFLFTAALSTLLVSPRPMKVLELGSGTGLGGLALLKYVHNHWESDMIRHVHITLTDADPAALDLCRRNAILNHFDKECVAVEALTWGESDNTLLDHSFSVILACDILYDIRMLPAIGKSATQAARKSSCTFYLSHVPRACYNASTTPDSPEIQDLEGYIVHQITKDGHWRLDRIWRPQDLPQSWNPPSRCLNHTSLTEMQDMGAALFVFTKSKA